MTTRALRWLPTSYAVTRLEASATWPTWALKGDDVVSVTRRGNELSILAPESVTPSGGNVEGGWVGVEVEGPLDFEIVGVLADLSRVLAAVSVPIFVISTFDTDLIFFKVADSTRAADALSRVAAVSGEPPPRAAGSRGSATR